LLDAALCNFYLKEEDRKEYEEPSILKQGLLEVTFTMTEEEEED
jgi:hypothetical protein